MSVEIGAKSAKSEPNVVPLCDILLVLLIIFMVVTPMIQPGANVELPEAKHVTSLPDPAQMSLISIKKTGEVFVDSQKEPLADLEKLGQLVNERLEELTMESNKKVLIKVDMGTSYGRLVDVLNKLKEAQIEVIGLVTEQKASSME